MKGAGEAQIKNPKKTFSLCGERESKVRNEAEASSEKMADLHMEAVEVRQTLIWRISSKDWRETDASYAHKRRLSATRSHARMFGGANLKGYEDDMRLRCCQVSHLEVAKQGSSRVGRHICAWLLYGASWYDALRHCRGPDTLRLVVVSESNVWFLVALVYAALGALNIQQKYRMAHTAMPHLPLYRISHLAMSRKSFDVPSSSRLTLHLLCDTFRSCVVSQVAVHAQFSRYGRELSKENFDLKDSSEGLWCKGTPKCWAPR